ncbi:hypothetical protein BCR34DRAFT_269204 [Clohesyomyces aquaticus]|uniref:Uncharacterized protein n=1 Tax=Clohesyomyces aquaticus TaxID=1231657 RepID=A0A1Y1ZT56_9PLEO|nr:hypothetical protein BCR34DRAFT_269204 [Clohesyomyces aquaticus]
MLDPGKSLRAFQPWRMTGQRCKSEFKSADAMIRPCGKSCVVRWHSPQCLVRRAFQDSELVANDIDASQLFRDLIIADFTWAVDAPGIIHPCVGPIGVVVSWGIRLQIRLRTNSRSRERVRIVVQRSGQDDSNMEESLQNDVRSCELDVAESSAAVTPEPRCSTIWKRGAAKTFLDRKCSNIFSWLSLQTSEEWNGIERNKRICQSRGRRKVFLKGASWSAQPRSGAAVVGVGWSVSARLGPEACVVLPFDPSSMPTPGQALGSGPGARRHDASPRPRLGVSLSVCREMDGHGPGLWG